MHEFDYEISNYTVYSEPILLNEAIQDVKDSKSLFNEQKKTILEDIEGYKGTFYICWAVHNENPNWAGYLILHKLKDSGEFIIADGICY